MEKVKVKFIKDHFTASELKKGDLVEVPQVIADGLVKDGFCELVKKKKDTK